MKFMLLLLAFTGYVALANSSLNQILVHPGGVGGLYKGPNSETIIKGPDGSIITAQDEGGSITTHDLSQPIVVADTVEVEPLQQVVPAISVAPAPLEPAAVPLAVTATSLAEGSSVASAASVAVIPVAAAIPVGHTVEVIQPDPHIIETEIVDAPLVEPQQSSDLVGPSGSISTRGSSSIVSGPASTTISEPAKILVAAVPVIASVKTPLRLLPNTNYAAESSSNSLNPILSTDTVGRSVVTANVSPNTFLSSVSPQSTLSEGTLSVPAFVSTLAPATGTFSTTVSPLNEISTTFGPPRVWETDNDINSRASLSTPTPTSIFNQQVANSQLSTSNVGAFVQPASSYGVINNGGNTLQLVSTTPRSEILLPTISGPIASTTPNTNLDFINNRQLSINPSLIPSANIIPPEIGVLPPGAIDLGTTVTVSTTPGAPGSISASPTESSNIRRISSGSGVLQGNGLKDIDGRVSSLQTSSVSVDGRIDQLGTNQISAQSQILLSNNGLAPQPASPVPLLRDTNPISVGIPRTGLVGSQLANYGVDSSQIELENIPLSSVSTFPQTLDQEIDDVSAQLWNRYGRDVTEKKLQDKNGSDKEK